MYYHLSDHIYIAQFQDELILLDIKQDKYIICFEEFSEFLLKLIEVDQFISKDTAFISQQIGNIQQLINDGVITKRATPYLFHIDRKFNSSGVSNVDWRLPLESKKISLSAKVLEALITLVKVNCIIKIKGFYSAIQLIKKSRRHYINYTVPPHEELTDLANAINQACFIYPTKTKCLEWALTYVLLALKRNWKCNLEIGVQNYPFFAHAWVECDGYVVMDLQVLRDGLAIILAEPFRKLRA